MSALVPLPDGVRHYNTQVFADTEERYQKISGAERVFWVDEDGEHHHEPTVGARLHRSKKYKTLDGFEIVVFPPIEARS